MFKTCSRASTDDDKYPNLLATNALKININHRIPESTCQSMYDEVRNAIFNHTGSSLRLTCKEILLEINQYNYFDIGNSYTVIQLWSSS